MYQIYSSNISSIAQSKHDDKLKFNSKIVFIIVLGIIFHSIYSLSIFDIYFRSPLVHGMTPNKVNSEPPSKRLVLFVADGLRADKFFEITEENESRSPFLRGIVENKGSWGVSHTRVPTETRPGHVALIAGFYEDVSAVTKGWKSNPVEFDHFFNETRYSFAYGSPDVVPMFEENVPQMTAEAYPPEAEDFASSDASSLDTWVFKKIEQLFKNASVDPVLNSKLRSNQISIFLHLLGLDTNGHAYRPYSKEYYDNIKLVDKGIEKIYKLVEEFYGDSATSYIFTADHGMSNRGSHGDGERANTETPLVAWGAGVRGPLSVEYQMEKISKLKGKAKEELVVNSETPASWKLSHLMRSDVSQADIAPLMSSLIGVPCPLNSVGVLPIEYLGTSGKYTSEALLANTLQIWDMYKVASKNKQQSSLLFFSPFTKLENADQQLNEIQNLINSNQFDEAQFQCQHFISLCLEGLNYFQTYDRPLLMTIITLGYTGWIITVLLYVMNNYSNIGFKTNPHLLREFIPKFERLSKILMILGSVILFGYLFSNESPILYYLYSYFVIFFWGKTIPANILPLYLFLKDSSSSNLNQGSMIKDFLILFVVTIGLMELLVVSYFYRSILSIGYLLFALLSSIFIYKKNISIGMKITWILSCSIMSVFPTLPIDYGSDIYLVCIGGLFVVVIGVLKQYYNISRMSESIFKRSSSGWKKIEVLLIISILFSIFLVYNTDSSLEMKIGLPRFNQLASWFLLVASIIILGLYSSKSYYDHWSFISLSLSIPFILLSVSYESIFIASFILNLTLWMTFELLVNNKIENLKSSNREIIKDLDFNISQSEIRRVIIYIFFCYVGFFGTGNIASISSFEISSTYRFTTIFDPFLMAALLLVKVFIPLLLVIVSFSFLNNSLGIPRPASFLVVIALSDIMCINFFFLVKDYGSWLEIGISISHFAISSGFIILQLLLFSVSSFLVPTISNKAQKEK